MDKQIQFSINRNMLILVSVIIILLIIALCARGYDHRGYKMNMMRGGDMMMQKKMQAGYPAQQGRWMQPPTEEQLASTSIELQ